MKKETIAPASAQQPQERALLLGRWLGRREAFGALAGRCSAADIECLRQIRDQQLFKDRHRNWDEFCKKELHVTRRTIEKEIGYLEEFGPQFFQLAQLTRISPAQYRAIRQHIETDGVHIDGRVVALLEGNAEEISAAVGELRRRTAPPAKPEPKPEPPPEPAAPTNPAEEMLLFCDRAAEAVECKPVLDSLHRAKLGRALRRLLNASARLGVYAAR